MRAKNEVHLSCLRYLGYSKYCKPQTTLNPKPLTPKPPPPPSPRQKQNKKARACHEAEPCCEQSHKDPQILWLRTPRGGLGLVIEGPRVPFKGILKGVYKGSIMRFYLELFSDCEQLEFLTRRSLGLRASCSSDFTM